MQLDADVGSRTRIFAGFAGSDKMPAKMAQAAKSSGEKAAEKKVKAKENKAKANPAVAAANKAASDAKRERRAEAGSSKTFK